MKKVYVLDDPALAPDPADLWKNDPVVQVRESQSIQGAQKRTVNPAGAQDHLEVSVPKYESFRSDPNAGEESPPGPE